MTVKDCKITIRIEETLKSELVEYARKKDVSYAQIIREAIKEYIKEEK